MSRVGGQIAVGQRQEPDRLGVYFIDAGGVLNELSEREGAWHREALPRGDGLPFGTADHPPGSVATAYRRTADLLEVFAVDRDGMLRVYTTRGGKSWDSDVVPGATGLPPGACLATGFEPDATLGRDKGAPLLDVFTTGRTGRPVLFQSGTDGRWSSGELPTDALLPYGANLATGYEDGRTLLSVFAVDREGALICFAQGPDGAWETETAEDDGEPLPPGAPLAVGYPGGGEPSVFAVDRAGRLREFRRRHSAFEAAGIWSGKALPVDGIPPLAAVATGYQARPRPADAPPGAPSRQLLVFVIDEVGRLRQYASEAGGPAQTANGLPTRDRAGADTYTVGVVPNGLGLAPGSPLAVGYRAGGALLDLFALARSAPQPVHYTARDGGWTGPGPI